MDKLDVVIIHHPTNNIDRPIVVPAMGLFSIADWLDRNGLAVRIVHLGLEKMVDPGFDIAGFISSHGVKVVAISVHWFFQIPDSLQLARALKEAFPEIIVVMGGFSASLFASEIAACNPCVDAIVRGDGEHPLLELCRGCGDGRPRDWSGISNLVYRSSDGTIEENGFDYSVSEAELAQYRFSNMTLLNNYRAYLKLSYSPTKRFESRFHYKCHPIFPLEVGRGCPFACTFCGGNRDAQLLISNRSKPLFRPVDSVMQTIDEAMRFGYENFYLCFDPVPNGDYYPELFKRIREERFNIGFIFGCWGLPDRRFVDAFKETFSDGMFEISPETADDGLRKLNKGPLGYSSEELETSLAYVDTMGLVSQLFFGYFLAGDTAETVRMTRRYVHECEDRYTCEAYYLAFSSDPGSYFHLQPDKYNVNIRTRTLQDYIDALAEKRTSPNLLAHRPADMSAQTADELAIELNADQFAHKVLPRSIQALRLALKDQSVFDDAVGDFLSRLGRGDVADREKLGLERLVDGFKSIVRDRLSDAPDGQSDLVSELADYESLPYSIMDKHFGKLSLHYTLYCEETPMDNDQRRAFSEQTDTVSLTREFRYDLPATMADLAKGVLCEDVARDTVLEFIVSKSGKYTVCRAEGQARRW